MRLLREYIRNLLSEQANPTLDKVVKLVKTGHENQALEFMVMMPEELDATMVITRLRDELEELRAITRAPEVNYYRRFGKKELPDPGWDEFVKFADGFSNFIGFTSGSDNRLDPDNWNPHHRVEPRNPLAKTHDRWMAAEDMIEMLQQRIDEAE